MGLDIAQEQQDALRILALRGRLDTDTSADLELAVQDLLAAGARDFLIDLGEVSYVSSAGLRVLLALAKQLEGSKGRLRLCALSPAVFQVFEVAGFSKLFAILKDRSSAVGAGAAKQTPPPVPTLAQQVARILRVGPPNPARSTTAAALAREASQLLGVRQAAVAAAGPARVAPVVAAPVAESPAPAKPGMFDKLRGVFGKKN